MRVADLNMTDPTHRCPVGFKYWTSSTRRFCFADIPDAGCGSLMYESLGLTYSQVCGRVLAYARGRSDAFSGFPTDAKVQYVDGVSITYGDESNHVWTYAVGHQETEGMVGNCPCNNQSGHSPPSFVGNDYYCEAGSLTTPSITSWYINDPLWDGMQCGGDEGPCCSHTGLPWFTKNLPTPTTASVNVRACRNDTDGNTGITHIELYLK